MNTPKSVTYALQSLDGTSKTKTSSYPDFLETLADYCGLRDATEFEAGQTFSAAGVHILAVERRPEEGER